MKVVVLPTYNEAQNLPLLVEQILGLQDNMLGVLIVDDNSPDGTGEIADELARKYPERVEVIHRQRKLGLGTAYVAGFSRALEKGANFVIQMDADFSHSPEYIPELIREGEDYDVVVGSRYVPGGRVDPRWGWWRKFLSWAGNLYLRRVIGLKVRDATTGFKGFTRKALEGLDLKGIRSKGYIFQVEIAHACQKKGYQVKEVPITFKERAQGKSKLSLKIVWEALWRAWQLRFS
jgi:dolichol-phosphate mannosyltransferase